VTLWIQNQILLKRSPRSLMTDTPKGKKKGTSKEIREQRR